MDGGTPKNLDEAIVEIMCVGPLNEIRERGYKVMKDFIAQKIGTAMLRADGNKEIEDALQELFRNLTERTRT